jgi:GT2 family glycosyltransferase
MADAAYKLTTAGLSQSELVGAALVEAAAVASGGARRHGGKRTPRRARSPRPAPPNPTLDELRKTASELKDAYVAQLGLSRRIESMISLVEHGAPDHVDVISTPAWPSFEPQVSVVVPFFNHERHIAEVVQSVIAASGGEGPRAELIIVDDHSTDQSAHVVERHLEQIAWFPATLVRRATNGGSPVACNTGFEMARAPHVLRLDPGTTLYPTGLRRLLESLETAPSEVAAVYGILERFDTTGSLGLTNHLPWDPELLVRGEFIDAVAMFRREAWSELGGYPTADEIHGWEDRDLWLTVAERGLRAEIVRSVVGRQRQPSRSTSTISDVDMASTFVTLRARHPRLPWPS